MDHKIFRHSWRIALLCVAVVVNSCGNEHVPGTEREGSVIPDTGRVLIAPYDSTMLETSRNEKDAFFRGSDSPIPEERRTEFAGLKYYPFAHEYVFDVVLERFANLETVEIATTGGDTRNMVRYGSVTFQHNDTICTLVVYKPEDAMHSLFVPFRDATNGAETYEAGRYLDIPLRAEHGRYTLDFNYAYSPYCAYNPRYTCPIVPLENMLPVAIRAGEMNLYDSAVPH